MIAKVSWVLASASVAKNLQKVNTQIIIIMYLLFFRNCYNLPCYLFTKLETFPEYDGLIKALKHRFIIIQILKNNLHLLTTH